MAAFHRSGDPEVGDHGNSALHLPVPGSHRVALVLYQTHIGENVAAPDGTLPAEPEQMMEDDEDEEDEVVRPGPQPVFHTRNTRAAVRAGVAAGGGGSGGGCA